MNEQRLSASRIAGRIDDLLIDGIAQESPSNVSAERRDFWREERISDAGIEIVEDSTATPKPPVDPYSPVVIPET
jgi:hypothetical protein